MSKSDAWEHDLLLLYFNNVPVAGLGDATGLRGSTIPGNIYISLHTADPGEGGDQSTNEVAYGSYARVGVARPTGWVVTGGSVSPAAIIQFPRQTDTTSGTITHVGIGRAASGAGVLDYSGPLNPTITMGNAVQPEIATSMTLTED